MESYIIEAPDDQQVRSEIVPLVSRADLMVITNSDEHEQAGLYLVQLAKMERWGQDLFRETKQKAHLAHKAACAAESSLLAPIQGARRLVTQKMGNYEVAERRKADEERRRLEAIAKKQEEDRLLAEAAAAEEAGDRGLAETIMEEAETAPAPVIHVAPEISKVSGVSTREVWRAEVTDLPALVRWVAEHADSHLGLVTANMSALHSLARSMKGGMRIPGVKAVCEYSKSVRAGAA